MSNIKLIKRLNTYENSLPQTGSVYFSSGKLIMSSEDILKRRQLIEAEREKRLMVEQRKKTYSCKKKVRHLQKRKVIKKMKKPDSNKDN